MTEPAERSARLSTRTVGVWIAVFAAVVVTTGFVVDRARSGPRTGSPALLAVPVEMPAMELTDTEGQPFDLRNRAAGRVTLLYFGYANCPDVCPITTGVLAMTMAAVPPDVRAAVQVVFVTVDPARDRPDQIRSFLDQFDPSFVGLTATPEQLDQLQAALAAPGAVAEPPDGRGGYLVGHTARVYLFEEDGIARRAYPFGTRQAEWMAVLQAVAGR